MKDAVLNLTRHVRALIDLTPGDRVLLASRMPDILAAITLIRDDLVTVDNAMQYTTIETPQRNAIVNASLAYMDQLNAFNDIAHPEVHRRRLELSNAVSAYYKHLYQSLVTSGVRD